jgi:hypothetical protein
MTRRRQKLQRVKDLVRETCINTQDALTLDELATLSRRKLETLVRLNNADNLPARQRGACFLVKTLARAVREKQINDEAPINPLTNTPLPQETIDHIQEMYELYTNHSDSDTESDEDEPMNQDPDEVEDRADKMGAYAIRVVMGYLERQLRQAKYHDLNSWWIDSTHASITANHIHKTRATLEVSFVVNMEKRSSPAFITLYLKVNFLPGRTLTFGIYDPSTKFIMTDRQLITVVHRTLQEMAQSESRAPGSAGRGR